MQKKLSATAIPTKGIAEIFNESENYSIVVKAMKNYDILEMAEITIALPDGNGWIGTIQDFKAMQSYMGNAFKAISNYGGEPEELKEIQAMLSHFGQTVELPPPSPERSKELALISCIMTHNFFEDMMKHSRTQGMIHCYDLIADWAGEFYDKYRYHEEWEDVPADFPGATGWEDSICLFTKSKIEGLWK
jgi:hypothetical protein